MRDFRMLVRPWIGLVILAAVMSGCGVDRPQAVPNCPVSFDFKSSDKPLGNGAGLLTAARTAALGQAPVTLRDVTRAAGLKDDWDRMVVVFPGTKISALNEDSGVSDTCWKNLPSGYGDDTPHAAYYLFVRAEAPIQAIHWFYPNDRELDFMTSRTKVVYPETLLAPVHVAGVEPYLRPVAN